MWNFKTMKKFFIYILIIFTAIGVFGVQKTYAEDVGDCYIYYGHATPTYDVTKTSIINVTCDTYKNATQGVTATWYKDGLPSMRTAWRCYDGSGYTTSEDEKNCAKKNFAWAQGPIKNRPSSPPAGLLGTCNTSNYKTQEFVSYANKTKEDCDALKTADVEVDWISDNVPNTTYKLLAPLPCPPGSPSCENGMLTTYEVGDKNQLSRYLNTALQIFIGICAVLAMIMIIIGGLEYMTSELVSSKESGKDKITQAIFGLLLALGAWTILNTINPDFLKTDLGSLTESTLFIEGPEMEVSGEDAKAICGKKVGVNGQTATSCAENEIVPVSFLGSTVRVNRAIVDDIRAIDRAVKNSRDPKVRAYQVTQLGSFNPRHATNSKSPSAHAFGLGLDINHSKNPYSEKTSPCTTNMPPGFVKLFTDRGFGWGGYWHSKKDTMHFSKLPNERQYITGTCAGLK